MGNILSSIACNPDTNTLLASLELLSSGKVEALEWSFDSNFKKKELPHWFADLLDEFARENRLIGHGIFFSLFSGKWKKEQQVWLTQLEKVAKIFHFDHVTEHFGFMTGKNFHQGAPLGIPLTPSTLSLGIDRLKRIQDACQCPVGIENLAFAYSFEEVKRHGEFLRRLIEPMNGFIILDLHNIYCQMYNFDLSFEQIIELYPLDKVREIHISGGSWEQSKSLPEKNIRRDTHDAEVPDEVFVLLRNAIQKCTNLKFVVLEQIGSGLAEEIQRRQFQNDFFKMDTIVQSSNKEHTTHNNFMPPGPLSVGTIPYEDLVLNQQQIQLSGILETASSYEHAKELLAHSDLHNSEWKVENWDPYMLETAISIAQKWKNGF